MPSYRNQSIYLQRKMMASLALMSENSYFIQYQPLTAVPKDFAKLQENDSEGVPWNFHKEEFTADVFL